VTVDAAVRLHRAGFPDIEQVARTVDDGDPRTGWWLAAVRAERLLVDADFEGIGAVAAVVDELPANLLADPLTLYLRGRLRRSLGLAHLGDSSTREYRSLWSGAVDDFRRCGFDAELAVTRALFTALRALMRWEDTEAALRHVLEARADVAEVCDPDWFAWMDFFAGLIALSLGDAARVRAAGAGLAASLPPGHPYHPVGPFFDAMAGLLDGRAVEGPLAVVECCVEAVRGVLPRLVPLMQLQAANVLGDLGHPAAAGFGVAALDAPGGRPSERAENDLRAWRVEALRGYAGPSAEVSVLLDELAGQGYGHSAAVKALRVAQDYRRLGAHVDAGALRRWGLDHLATDRERRHWDLRWSAGLADAGTADPPPAGGRGAAGPAAAGGAHAVLRVLAPVLELSRGGRPVTVRPAVARLLLQLVLAHPAPVHIEQAADRLWPELALGAARSRLNTTVHRLRGVIGEREATLRRTGDVLQLEIHALEVDLLAYRKGLRGDPRAQAAAVTGVRGNLCHVQFPYDEALVQERHELASQWSQLARRLLARGDLAPGDLEPVFAAVELAVG
jgi:hypothetical protein